MAQSEDVERVRMLAERAVQDNDVALAVKYHRQLRDLLLSPGEKAQAGVNIISLLVESGEFVQAESELKEFEKSFGPLMESDPAVRAKAAYFGAVLEMSRGVMDAASEKLRALIEPYPQPDKDFNCRILLALVLSGAARGDWDIALKYSRRMESEGAGESWTETGRALRMAALLQSGKDIAAEIKKPDGAEKAKLSGILSLYALGLKDEALQSYRKLDRKELAGKTSSVFSLWALSLCAIRTKDYQSAALFLNDARAMSRDRLLSLRLGILCADIKMSKGETKEAIRIYEDILGAESSRSAASEVVLKYADALFADGQKEKAMVEYERLVGDKNPETAMKAATQAASSLISAGDFASAERMISRIPSIGSPAAASNAAILYAELHLAKGDYPAAAARFAKIAADFPELRDDALFGQVKSFYRSGDFKKTMSTIRERKDDVSKSRHMQELLFMEAMAARRAAGRDEAMRMLDSYSEKYPNSGFAPEVMREAAEILVEDGRYREASAKFSAIAAKYPDSDVSQHAVYRKIGADVLAGDFEAAEKTAVSMTEKWPGSRNTALALLWLADFKRDSGRSADAEKTYLKVKGGFPGEKDLCAEALLEAAKIAVSSNDMDRGFSMLDELSEKFPEQPSCQDAQFFRGDVLSGRGDYEKAIPFFMKAAMRKPDSPVAIAAYGRLGDCHFALSTGKDREKMVKAAEFYSKVADASKVPVDFREQALYKLGRCEEKLGDPGAALARYREMLASFDVDWRRGFRRDTLWLVKAATAAMKIYIGKGDADSLSEAEKLYADTVAIAPDAIGQMRQNLDAAAEKHKK